MSGGYVWGGAHIGGRTCGVGQVRGVVWGAHQGVRSPSVKAHPKQSITDLDLEDGEPIDPGYKPRESGLPCSTDTNQQ